MSPKWRKVPIPIGMYKYIQQIIIREEVKEKYRFHSVPDFVRIAIQDKIREVEATTKD